MPPRDNPTARQARLGAELRKLRERAGRTAREAAGLLSIDQAKISHIEAGRVGVSEERIRRLATFYSCDDEPLIAALCGIAAEHRGQHWFDEYRGILTPGFLDVAELELHATALRSMQSVTFPGIFQTENYARALFEGVVPKLPPDEVDARVEYRRRRICVFERDTPPRFEAIIHEAALRMRFGGRKVVREQLEHLVDVSHMPLVTVRVIPFTSEDFIEVTQPVLYAHGIVPQLDTVQIDAAFGGRFLDAEADLQKYRALFDIAERASLDPEESRQLIHHIAREM
ncbi:helix-turn-helix domain-containing protein [Streptomyces griseoviridis]|uniref:Transcriptional regulator n=2 Tax=Streptomyces TaxID=1883 RepID=A0A3S9ZF92_STRGD|nr:MULTISPECIES: helix-turn-helix transcriptional regulator [Streptomyces]AZS86446.1 XRE family transcriptional regulator [Streptomyces griseoviridis]MDH6700123.1 transcriptional regulator with XRE-family HTH domain [Streptomyces sp. MAA16]MDT0476048.1 helix-turn-helix transcriptional regulator [Streptomyces sp. DSM 41014]QCN86691.1 transcriptional regulator [Streptomyces griseoviridis]